MIAQRSHLGYGIANGEAFQRDILLSLHLVLVLGLLDEVRRLLGRVLLHREDELVIAGEGLGGYVIVGLTVIAARIRGSGPLDYHDLAAGCEAGVLDRAAVFEELDDGVRHRVGHRTGYGDVAADRHAQVGVHLVTELVDSGLREPSRVRCQSACT